MADFQTEVVIDRATGSRISHLSAATDAQGRPHLLFSQLPATDNAPVEQIYATRGAGGWTFETVWTGSLFSPKHSLVLDSTGRPHIVLVDTDTRDILYGVRDTGGWSFETVASNAHTASPAIDLDSMGRPHVAFVLAPGGGFGGPQLATRDESGQWILAPSLLPDRLPQSVQMDLVLDRNDKPYLTYSSFLNFSGPQALSVVTTDEAQGGALTFELDLQGDPSESLFNDADLEIDNDGELRLIVEISTASGPEVDHYARIGGQWETDFQLGQARRLLTPSSMAVDGQNQSLILRSRIHSGIGSGAVELWTLGAGAPTQELLASGLHSDREAVGLRNEIVVDDAGGIHIFYTSDLSNGITYAYIPEPAGLLVWGAVLGLVGVSRHMWRS